MKGLLSLVFTFSSLIALSQYSVSTVAGSGITGFSNGPANLAQFNRPVGIVVDDNQNLIVADFRNHCIRKVDSSGTVSTVAGNCGVSGFADGNGSAARFNGPGGVDVDQNGNIFVTDNFNQRIRKIDPQGNVTTLAGNGNVGYVNGTGSSVELNIPRDLVVDRNNGVIYFVGRNNVVRKLGPTGFVSTFAGDGIAGFVNGPIAQARFNFLSGIAIDHLGNIYVTEQGNHSVRLITNGTVSTVAGTGTRGFNDGPAINAQFDRPVNIDVDENGKLYVCDFDNNRIRAIDNGVVTTLAGDGIRAFRNGPSQISQIGETFGLAVFKSHTIYFNDASAERVRMLQDTSSLITNLTETATENSALDLSYNGQEQVKYNSAKAFNIMVYSVDGKLITQERKLAGNGDIQLPALTSGLYIIYAIDISGECSSLKFNKN